MTELVSFQSQKGITKRDYAVEIECCKPECFNKFLRSHSKDIFCEECRILGPTIELDRALAVPTTMEKVKRARRIQSPNGHVKFIIFCQHCDKEFEASQPKRKFCDAHRYPRQRVEGSKK